MRPSRLTKTVQWIERDHPGLSVHVVSFTDLILVILSWSHVLSNARGRQSFLQAWQAILNGKDDEVRAFMPYEEDPISYLAKSGDPRDHFLYDIALTGIWSVLSVVDYIHGILFYSKDWTHGSLPKSVD